MGGTIVCETGETHGRRRRAGWGAGDAIVTVAANHGLIDDVFRLVCTVGEQSSKFSFEANIATNSSKFTGVDGGGFAAAGRRLQIGGANLNIPLSFGKGLAYLCG